MLRSTWIPAGTPAGADTIATASVRRFARSSWSVLASAVVPGAGQAMMGQKRAIAYLALEAVAWSSFASHRRVARRKRDSYRTLASAVARAPYSSVRPVGDFDYYERMEHFAASGRFDLAAGGEMLRPAEDTATFTGAMWLLARRTYWNDASQPPPRASVEWTRAEAFYLQRAIRPEYQWSWGEAADEYAQFRQLIRRSNDKYRSALSDLGLALGNHVLSAIDASISVRLEHRRVASTRQYRVYIQLPFDLGRYGK
ncbi:MAG: hypothetical protein IT508_11310 [Burkholderiaceae bacterium]|nr:hypothetical protein [Burkholderiaceae bacterium]